MEKNNFGQHLQRIWHKQQSCNRPAMLCYITQTLGTCSVGGRRLPLVAKDHCDREEESFIQLLLEKPKTNNEWRIWKTPRCTKVDHHHVSTGYQSQDILPDSLSLWSQCCWFLSKQMNDNLCHFRGHWGNPDGQVRVVCLFIGLFNTHTHAGIQQEQHWQVMTCRSQLKKEEQRRSFPVQNCQFPFILLSCCVEF